MIPEVVYIRPAYIDVRGAWPCYVNGMLCITFMGYPRDITVAEAENLTAADTF